MGIILKKHSAFNTEFPKTNCKLNESTINQLNMNLELIDLFDFMFLKGISERSPLFKGISMKFYFRIRKRKFLTYQYNSLTLRF